MGLTGLTDASLKLILFGGKGGVGKTTCAISAGLYLAQGFTTLIVSTDPAHSLSDSLGQEFGDEVKPVVDVPRLYAMEISAKKALDRFKMNHEKEIKNILDTSTYLDQEDVEAVFSLPVPGIDEVMGLETMIDFVEQKRFDKLVVDMAPTGHALRLLGLPDLLDDWVKVMARLRWKYRYMVTSLAGKYRPDESDDFLLATKKTIARIHALFRDRKRCEFVVVTIPEAMAVFETERMLRELSVYGIEVKQMVINNFMPLNESCRFCSEKRKGQEEYVDYLARRMSNTRITLLPMQPREVKGVKALESFGALLFE